MKDERAAIITQKLTIVSTPHTNQERKFHIFTGGFTYLSLEMCNFSCKKGRKAD